MAKGFSTAGLARLSARRPWRVIALWVVLLALAAVAASGLGDVLTTESTFEAKPESVIGQDLLEDRMRGEAPVTETIIISADAATIDDDAFKQMVINTTNRLREMPEVVTDVTNVYEAGEEGLVSDDRRATLLPVTMTGDWDEAESNASAYLDTVLPMTGNGFNVYTIGDVSINDEFNHIAETDLQRAEILGLPIALLILVVVFGALVAAGIPIVLALVSIFVALGVTALVGRAYELSFFATNMITMIGLAVGIDYALFIVERYREERRRGVEKMDAISIAGGTASKAVVFSGMTVVLALAGMLIIPTNIFRSLGLGAIIVVLVAVAATMTLIPAMLSLLGDKVDWPRKPRPIVENPHSPERIASGFWGRVTTLVMRRPVVAVVSALTILLLCSLPYVQLNLGSSGAETLPESRTRTGLQILEDDFYVGRLAPIEIVVDGNVQDPAIATGIDNLVATLGSDDAFGRPEVTQNDAGDLTLISSPLAMDANSSAAYDRVDWLRDSVVPDAFGSEQSHVYVSGDTAFNTDFNDLIDQYTPIVFGFVLTLSFILLTLAFRSIVVPIKAILMNLLSVGATYGLLVLAFQEGWGKRLGLGLAETPTVDAWVPIFLFCVLFGLSMDYHVFLLSRIREHYDLTGNNRESVAVGLHSTAKIITGAALIMVAVFTGFAMGELVMMQQMGFGLAIAVFLDATIVRSVLVPSSMALLGNRNWYLPRWLHWLPDLRVEGTAAHTPAPAPAPAVATVPGGGDD